MPALTGIPINQLKPLASVTGAELFPVSISNLTFVTKISSVFYDNSVKTSAISALAVTTEKINNSAVTTLKLADSSVLSGKIADGNITTIKLANSAVTTDKISNSAVSTLKIASSSVTTDKLANLSVTTGKINDLAVTTGKINDLAVTTGKIVDSAIIESKIAISAVTTDKISDFNISESKIAGSAVTTNKIADSAVVTAKIADGSVNSLKIAVNSITTPKILNYAVTNEKIAASAVTAEKIATNAVGNSEIANGSVTPNKLSTGGPTWGGGTFNTDVQTGLELGPNITDNTDSFIDFHSAPGGDYDARVWRRPDVNGNLDIYNKGSGSIWLNQIGNGNINFATNNTSRGSFDNGGNFNVNKNVYIGGNATSLPPTAPSHLTTKQYVDAAILAASQGDLHFLNGYSQATSLDGDATAAMINWGRTQMGASMEDGDFVLVRWNQYYSYRWGNGTSYANREFLVVYRNNGWYPNNTWTAQTGAYFQ